MRTDKIASQACPIARSSVIVGDPWVLLILREAFNGRRRFAEFVEFTRAQPSVVSDRLKRLVAAGVLESSLYQEHPPRNEYTLTPKGRDLEPLLLALAAWGNTHLGEDDEPGTETNDAADPSG